MTESPTRPFLTLLGASDAVSCDGDTCALPSLAEVTAAVQRAFTQGR